MLIRCVSLWPIPQKFRKSSNSDKVKSPDAYVMQTTVASYITCVKHVAGKDLLLVFPNAEESSILYVSAIDGGNKKFQRESKMR